MNDKPASNWQLWRIGWFQGEKGEDEQSTRHHKTYPVLPIWLAVPCAAIMALGTPISDVHLTSAYLSTIVSLRQWSQPHILWCQPVPWPTRQPSMGRPVSICAKQRNVRQIRRQAIRKTQLWSGESKARAHCHPVRTPWVVVREVTSLYHCSE